MMDTRLAIGAGLLGLMMAYAATAQELVSIDIGDAADAPGSTVIDGDTYTIEGTGGGGGGSQITWRPAEAGATEEFLGSAPGPWQDNECWIKLTRAGDEFHGYISEDGVEWQDLLAAEVSMSDPVLVGLAVCGLDDVATATYDSFTVVSGNRTLYPLDVDGRGKAAVMWGEMKSG